MQQFEMAHASVVTKWLLKSRLCRTQEDAEDVAQEVALRAFTAWGYEPVPAGWLYIVARRTAISEARRRHTEAKNKAAAYFALISGNPVDDPHEQMEQKETIERYPEALAALPNRLREVWLRRHVRGESTAEIAEEFGVSKRHVRGWLAKARRLLREQLE
jgi:RNA polymerase sigma-70 factor (ECF subfamily)